MVTKQSNYGDIIKMEALNLSLKPTYIPSLHDIHKSFDVIKAQKYDGITGEHEGRLVVFTQFIMSRKPCLLVGPRASGKTNMMKIVCVYAQSPMEVSSSSEKSDIRDEELNTATHIIIPEINKTSKSFIETLKDWGEGEDSKYKTLDEYRRVKKFTLEVKPFISSIADENDNVLGEELISRLTLISTDSSIKQNLSVMEDKLDRAQNVKKDRGITPKHVNDCITYVHSIPPIHNFDFIYLPGKSILGAIPARYTDSRRDIEKYLFNTYGITMFHYFDRIKISNGEDKQSILVTPTDVWFNHRIFGKNLIQSALKCGPQEMMIIDILRKYKVLHPTMPDMNLRDIYSTILKNGITPTAISIEKMCNNLYKNGIIIKNIDQKPITYESSNLFENHKVEIDWEVVVEECKKSVRENFPSVSEDYIKRFCTSPIMVIDPFTGKELNILVDKITEDEVKVDKKVSGLDVFATKKEDIVVETIIEETEEILEEEPKVEDKVNKLKDSIKSFFELNKGKDGCVDSDTLEKAFSKEDIAILIENQDITESRGVYMGLF